MNTQDLAETTRAVQQESATTPTQQDFESFIYLISHDVRGSVRALMEIPQWIEEDMTSGGQRVAPQMRAHIDMLNRHAQRLDRMLFDLLLYSRVGRMQIPANIDLDVTLETVMDSMHIPASFTVSRNFSQKLVRMGEPDALTLFTVLISNAIKHHHREAGEIQISSRQNGQSVLLRFTDNGPGIPAPMRARAFEAMKTLRPRDEVEGSGMGLAIAQKIAETYDGTIVLSTGPGGIGTCVEVSLPGFPVLN